MPARAKSVAAVALAVGIAPIALRTAGTAAGAVPERRDRPRRADVQGDPRRHRVRVRARRLLRRGLRGRHAAGHASSASRSARSSTPSRATRAARSTSSTRSSASRIFIAIGGDAWVIQGLARTYEAVPLLERARHRLARARACRSPSAASSAPRCRSARPCCSPSCSPTPRSASSRSVVPQLNVFAVGFPAKVTVGLRRDRRLAAVPRRLARRRAPALRRLRPARAEGERLSWPRRTRPRRQHPRSSTRPARRARSRARWTSTAPSC